MSLASWLRRTLQAQADEERDRIDALLSDIAWSVPAETVVRRDEIPLGRAYKLPGTMFPDGRERTVINTKQVIREEGESDE